MEDNQVNIRIVNIENDIDTIKGQVKCLQTVEDLRDEQMKALQSALKKTIAYIERDGYEWKVLDVPEAKK
jgi:adenosine/AMP kinase